MQVTLGPTELRSIISILEKQVEWNPNIAVRVVTSPNAVAFYSAIPLNLRAFIAMPAKMSPGQPCDVIVSGRDVVALLSNSQGVLNLTLLTSWLVLKPHLYQNYRRRRVGKSRCMRWRVTLFRW